MSNWVKYGLIFLAGAVVGIALSKNSDKLRSVCTDALGGFMDIRDKAVQTAEAFKESAADFVAESDSKRKA